MLVLNHEDRKLLERAVRALESIASALRPPGIKLRFLLGDPVPQSSTPQTKGNTTMPSANFQLGDSQKVQYSLIETDAAGNPVAPQAGDSISVSSSDTASATIVPDATPLSGTAASGFIVAGKKVQAGVVITATLSHGDGSPGLTAQDTIDIIAGAASTLAFSLGAPVAQ